MYYIIVDDYKIKTYPSSVLTKRIDNLIPHPCPSRGMGYPEAYDYLVLPYVGEIVVPCARVGYEFKGTGSR